MRGYSGPGGREVAMRYGAMLARGAAAVLAAGCGGDDGTPTDPNAVSCSGLATAPLTTVEVTRWPEGLADVLPMYDTIAGRWEAGSSCGGELAVKFTTVPRDALEVVTTPYATGSSNCGCIADPDYGSDEQYPMAAISTSFEYYVELFDDPALDARTLRGQGVLFGAGAPLAFRGCALDDVDPILQSAYDQVATIVRMDRSGAMTGSLVLTPLNSEPTECVLTGFRLIEAAE